ncbi:sugar nucleotide-binding protein [Microbacterium sp. Nx66]|uniref:sugar nucleotide-binding protein n=1 Tax=Microbacterium sp. Nx66 TaxID=2766784 RepID=UPI0016569A33|nr:sugar nucleotide-binding protein [Microbacterium sp. Nx66]
MTTPSPPRRALLVGFGKLGARLAPLLLGDGGEVLALRRSDGPVPDGVQALTADLAVPLTGPLPEVDAMVVTLPPGPDVSSYRTALSRLAAALPSPPARTLFVSSTGVFDGAGGAEPVTERVEPVPTTDRGRGLRDGERAAVELFDAVVVRPAGIYGPGREFLLRKVREGAPVAHRRRTNRIHETDLVRALDLLLRMPEPPALVHAVDRAPAPLGDVMTFLADRLGLPVPPDDGSAPSGFVYDGTLLRSVLGHLVYPTYEDGYAEMIDRS